MCVGMYACMYVCMRMGCRCLCVCGYVCMYVCMYEDGLQVLVYVSVSVWNVYIDTYIYKHC